MLDSKFFNRSPVIVAKQLLGKVLKVKYRSLWLSAMIIETEAYCLNDKASHASLGYTEKRKALFMPPGTIYMYYSRGGDSMNISCRGKGSAVLIKSAIPFPLDNKKMVACMQRLNPLPNGVIREPQKLCSGQTLLCKSLNLKVSRWDQQSFDEEKFYIDDVGYSPLKIIQAKRLGIPDGRDEDLFYRFIAHDYVAYCTSNPLKKKNFQVGLDYKLR